jgi:hypothetical protein
MELSKQSSNIEPLLNKAVMKLSSLDELYEKADNKDKREIIGSIYPEKLVFDGFHYRTARLNEAVELIYKLGEGFRENENGQTESDFDLSTVVPGIGIEPIHPYERQILSLLRLPIPPPGPFLKGCNITQLSYFVQNALQVFFFVIIILYPQQSFFLRKTIFVIFNNHRHIFMNFV